MKKLLFGSFSLFLFSVSILIFQVSCQKEANARINGGQQNKIVFTRSTDVDTEFWIANADGTSQQKLNINIPSGLRANPNISVNPDGTKIYISAIEKTGDYYRAYLYTTDITGNNLTRIIMDSLSGPYTGKRIDYINPF